jgi:hypothetical protein
MDLHAGWGLKFAIEGVNLPPSVDAPTTDHSSAELV